MSKTKPQQPEFTNDSQYAKSEVTYTIQQKINKDKRYDVVIMSTIEKGNLLTIKTYRNGNKFEFLHSDPDLIEGIGMALITAAQLARAEDMEGLEDE